MTRVEPRLAWTTPIGVAAAAPLLLLSKERGWAWRSALVASVLLHLGLAALVGDAVLDAANHAPPPSIEVDLVVPDAAAGAPAQPAAPPPPVAAPAPAPPPVAAEEPKKEAPPEKAAPAAAEPPTQAHEKAPVPGQLPLPKEAGPAKAPEPKEAAGPAAKPKSEPEKPVEHAQRPPEPKKPEPPRHAEPPRPQMAVRPSAPESGHNLERTDLAPEATIHPIVMPKPVYPEIALQLHEEGVVYLVVSIGADGVPKDIKLFQSSGFGSLDQAAVAMMKKWRFAPPTRNGKAVMTTVNVPVEFRLKHEAPGG